MSMEGPKASSSGRSSSSNNVDIGEDIKREVREWMRMLDPVRVMTEEQIEELREQISMFGAISEQLIEMHKSMTARGDAIAGISLGSQYCDPQMIPGNAPKLTIKQRWSPSAVQLKTLEAIFAQGNVVPSKQRIKEITSELLQHGEISEANVYNWFQNRRARSRRKQAAAAAAAANAARLSMKSEAETEMKCSKSIEDRTEKISLCQSREGSSEVRPVQPDSVKASPSMSYMSDDRLKPDKMSFYESGLLEPRIDQLSGEVELPEAFSYYKRGDGYRMAR